MSQTPEELEILAGMVDHINIFDNQLNRQMEKAPTVDSRVESNRIDKRQALTQLARHGRPDAHSEGSGDKVPLYQPNANDGFGDMAEFPATTHQAQQIRKQHPSQQQFVESTSLLPPSILTSILRKLISIETSVNKLVEKQKTTDNI
jgi:hypothetical protein